MHCPDDREDRGTEKASKFVQCLPGGMLGSRLSADVIQLIILSCNCLHCGGTSILLEWTEEVRERQERWRQRWEH